MKGSVNKHGNAWRYRIYRGMTNGKRRYDVVGGFRTEAEAQKALRKALAAIDTGTYVTPKRVTVAEYMEEWAAEKMNRGGIRHSTRHGYTWLVRLISEEIGSIELQKLTAKDVHDMHRRLQSPPRNLSGTSALKVHNLLHMALDQAVRLSIVERNVTDLVDAPKAEKHEKKVWTVEQSQTFLDLAAQNRYYLAFLLAIDTGLRQGEILALRWDDVELNAGTLRVQHSVYRYKGENIINAPKTANGLRSILLLPRTVEAMREQLRSQEEDRALSGDKYDESGYVIAQQNGNPLTESGLDNHWYALLAKASLPRITFHDLRHTHASFLLRANVNPKVISERLGHSNVAFTLQTYSHTYAEMQKEAINKLESMMSTDVHDNHNRPK